MAVKTMKTIKEIVETRYLDRSTLLKAAQRGAFGDAARKSGDTWLIDDTSPEFDAWLISRVRRGTPPETIHVESPDVPDWVNTDAGRHMWKNSLQWRGAAASATNKSYQRHLLRDAEYQLNKE